MEEIFSKIRGTSHKNKQGASIQRILRDNLDSYSGIYLERDPYNIANTNAIAVYADNDDLDSDLEPYHIGYLSDDLANRFASWMDTGNELEASIEEITGLYEDEKTIGVNIRLRAYTKEEYQPIVAQRRAAAEARAAPIQPALPTADARTPSLQTATPTQKARKVSFGKSCKSIVLALALCFLVGYFGVHLFYVGRRKQGYLYLFTIGLCGVGWLVDLVMIIIGQFKDSRGDKLTWARA